MNNSTTKYYNTNRMCPAILQLIVSGAISILHRAGEYAKGITLYVNPRNVNDAVFYDFETGETFPIDAGGAVR